MKYNLAFKYRIYPNKEQELLINNRLRIFFRRERNFQSSNLKRIMLKVTRQIV